MRFMQKGRWGGGVGVGVPQRRPRNRGKNEIVKRGSKNNQCEEREVATTLRENRKRAKKEA